MFVSGSRGSGEKSDDYAVVSDDMRNDWGQA